MTLLIAFGNFGFPFESFVNLWISSQAIESESQMNETSFVEILYNPFLSNSEIKGVNGQRKSVLSLKAVLLIILYLWLKSLFLLQQQKFLVVFLIIAHLLKKLKFLLQ